MKAVVLVRSDARAENSTTKKAVVRIVTEWCRHLGLNGEQRRLLSSPRSATRFTALVVAQAVGVQPNDIKTIQALGGQTSVPGRDLELVDDKVDSSLKQADVIFLVTQQAVIQAYVTRQMNWQVNSSTMVLWPEPGQAVVVNMQNGQINTL